ncbi:MAG: hypothetical protein ACQEXE_10355 [Bacillota bacterium]
MEKRTARKELPYGKYIFKDGSQILFNRYYEPILPKNMRDVDVEALNLKILEGEKHWFYTDANPPWSNQESLRKCQAVLKAFGEI